MMKVAGRDILTPDLTPHEHFLCSCPVCLLPCLASSCGAGLALSLGYTQRWHVAAIPLWLPVFWQECQAEQEAAKVKCWCKSTSRAGWCSLAVMLREGGGGGGKESRLSICITTETCRVMSVLDLALVQSTEHGFY